MKKQHTINIYTLLIVIISFVSLMSSCKDNESPLEISESDDIPELTSFSFLAADNEALYQDIVFTKKADFSYEAEVVHELDLNKLIATFDYSGSVKYNGKGLTSGESSKTYPDNFVLQFADKYVIFRVKRFYTIPTIYIETENQVGVTSKEDYVPCAVRVDGKNMYPDFTAEFADEAKIRGRGNSTWKYYDKKPYRIKLDKKSEFLGMEEAKKWVLLANYRDPTNFMNAITFDMAHYMEMPYTNSNRFAEVYLDNEYLGMYQITEQVEQGKNRVGIDEDLGVLLSLDLDDGPDYAPKEGDNFYSSVFELPICVKHPEDQNSAQLNAIKADFAEMEQYIKDQDYTSLSQRLDIQSMIDFLIIQELTRNVELVSPRSMYMYKDADNIYHFGPVWDFDGGFSFDWASMTNGHGYFSSQSWLMGSKNPSTHPSDAYNYLSGFFVDMFGNPQFVTEYQKRWKELEQGLLDYCFSELDEYVLHCSTAMKNNAKKWPVDKSYSEEIESMRNWLSTRVANYSKIVESY